MIFKSATIPLILAFCFGLLGFVLQYIPHADSHTIQNEIEKWFKIIGGFGMFLGAYSLLHMHVARIRRKIAGWGYSIFVFIGAAAMVILGVYNGGSGPLAQESPKDRLDWFTWGYEYVLVPCQATIFSILAFFMASAAFRTFRAKNLAAALLLIAAIIVMFGRVPFSETVSGWLFLGNKGVIAKAADILMNYPNLAAQRAVLLGVILAGFAQSLRVLFGIDRSYLGEGD